MQVQRMLTELHGNYLGESSEELAAHAEEYSSQLNNAAAHMAQNALLAYDFVDAFEAAYKTMVAPELIDDNRAQLQELTATNAFGKNTPRIADFEKEYQEFWAQDATAMETYAAKAKQALSRLEKLPEPPSLRDQRRRIEFGNKFISDLKDCMTYSSTRIGIDDTLKHLKESGYVNLLNALTAEGTQDEDALSVEDW